MRCGITALLTKGLAFQGVIGLLFTLLLIVLVSADFFAGFGSLLMFGFGYDTLLARIFGGYWEKSLGFAGGGAIGYSFGILGLLFSYLLGLFMVARAVKKAVRHFLPKAMIHLPKRIVPRGGPSPPRTG